MTRMNDKQEKTAQALIRESCCNYDRVNGDCLLLDRGEVVQCPQMITQSVVCRHFRDVLLEGKDGKALKAAIMGDDHLKACAVCGRPFRAISNRAKYCAECAKEIRLKQQRDYMRLKRG